MPSNILNTDTMFPQFLSNESTEARLMEVLNYLYMLREQLRYSLTNLGVENMNPTSLNEMANIITEPIYVNLEDIEGNVSTLFVTSEELYSRLSDTEGNVSTLMQTSASLTSRVEDAEGNITQLTQTSQSLSTSVSTLDGQVSTLQHTAQGLQTSVSNLDGQYTQLSQTVSGISTTVNGLNGNVSTLQQFAKSLSLSVTNGETSSVIRLTANGAQISSQNISFSGVVTFSDLSDPYSDTTIDGGHIETGTISAIDIEGVSIQGSTFNTVLSGSNVGGEIRCYYGQITASDYYLAGGLRLDNEGSGGAGESQYRLFLYTRSVAGLSFALKLESAAGISIEAATLVYISASQYITLDAPTVNIYGTLNNPSS